jgi:uncharacterized protein
MAKRPGGRAGEPSPEGPISLPPAAPKSEETGSELLGDKSLGERLRKDDTAMPAYGLRVPTPTSQVPTEGVSVTGEAVRRVTPESAEFLIEITSSAGTAAQAIRDNHQKTTQITQAVAPLGVQPGDVHSISLNLNNLYAPMMQALPGYAAMPQIAQGSLPSYGSGFPGQADLQFGSYQARNTIRVNVREVARVGEVADAVARAGATVVGGFVFRATDEALARRNALEAAGKDARARAEVLATATGKQLGDPVVVTEEITASNGAYMALRSAMPLAFGAGAPQVVGELEYYARVSATFRLQ